VYFKEPNDRPAASTPSDQPQLGSI
jgi:hypothetical protein